MHVDVRDFWCWCGDYLLNHFQVFRVYTVPTSGAQFLFTSSATRGSIVFMSWAFIFFLAGFLVPSIIQVAFSWGAKMPRAIKHPKIFKKLGEFLVSFAVFFGLFCMAAAVWLTLLSMYEVQYTPIPSGFSTDTPVLFTNSVRISFWVVVACASFECGLVVTLLVVFTLYNVRNPTILKQCFSSTNVSTFP